MMKSWKKTSLFTALALLIILAGLFHIFKISISTPSSDIQFSPKNIDKRLTPEFKGHKPKNIIVFIADGMGFNHLSLALQTQQSEEAPSIWQEFDVKGWHDARSSNGPLTDSEASATAMSTGTSTSFGHIGMDSQGNSLQNIFEIAQEKEYATGIVTDSYIWDGTPAAFSAHTTNEDNARDILTQISQSKLDLIFGELEDLGENGVPEEKESLEILEKRFQLLDKSLDISERNNPTKPIAAIFDEDEIQDLTSTPNLPKLTDVALTYLGQQNKPFILLVESEEMDAASHENDSKRVLRGLRSIQETLQLVLNFSQDKGETLVLFTADHETGGLTVVADFDRYPNIQMRWSTKDHTAAVVPLFADGPGANYFANVNRNWEIGARLKNLIRQEIFIETDEHAELR